MKHFRLLGAVGRLGEELLDKRPQAASEEAAFHEEARAAQPLRLTSPAR